MSESKHTPGPWEYRLEAVRTVIFHKGEIGERALAVGAGSYPAHIANARLIAAAPTMYEYIADSAAGGCATAAQIMESINADS